MDLGHCELISDEKDETLENYKKSVDVWSCSCNIWERYDEDFQFIEPHRISEKEYQGVKKELEEHCK